MPVEPDAPVILCVPPGDVPIGRRPPGTRLVRCGGCGADLILHPASRSAVDVMGAVPVCRACVPRGPLIPAMTGDQLADLLSPTPSPERN